MAFRFQTLANLATPRPRALQRLYAYSAYAPLANRSTNNNNYHTNITPRNSTTHTHKRNLTQPKQTTPPEATKADADAVTPDADAADADADAADADAATHADAPADETTARIAELEAQLEQAADASKEKHDQLLRTLAEMDNTRKRAATEVENAHKFAISKLAKELLDVADNLARAAESVPEEKRASTDEPALASLYEGVLLTDKEFHKTMTKFGICKMEPMGKKFDPNLHEAVFQMPSEDEEAVGTVGAVMSAGYTLHERTLRAAKVGICQKAS